MTAVTPEQVAPGTYRVADGLVNFYLVADESSVTVVDTGWPRSWPRLQAALSAIGRAPQDVAAILLSHAHPDHLGCAEQARTRCPAPVHVHDEEVARAKGQSKHASPFTMVPGLLPHLWRPSAFNFVLHATRHGFLNPTWLREVQSLRGGHPLEVPGNPIPLHTPGHTAGHLAWHFPDRGVLMCGDALATLDVLTRERGPRLMPDPLQDDPAQAEASLDHLVRVYAELLLPGHGDPWRGEPAEAVNQARAAYRGGKTDGGG